eukprot:3275982-Pleurochrysis_carterae.AAC.1
MSLTAVPLSAGVSMSPAERALADVARAVSAADRARDSVPARAISVQPPVVDFTTLDIPGWKRYSKLSLFRGKDGMVRFTEGRVAAARRPSGEDGVYIE